MLGKSPSIISPEGPPTSKQALLNIAKLLHTDKTPPLNPILVDLPVLSSKEMLTLKPPVPSEGEHAHDVKSIPIASSEGEDCTLPAQDNTYLLENTRNSQYKVVQT